MGNIRLAATLFFYSLKIFTRQKVRMFFISKRITLESKKRDDMQKQPYICSILPTIRSLTGKLDNAVKSLSDRVKSKISRFSFSLSLLVLFGMEWIPR